MESGIHSGGEDECIESSSISIASVARGGRKPISEGDSSLRFGLRARLPCLLVTLAARETWTPRETGVAVERPFFDSGELSSMSSISR